MQSPSQLWVHQLSQLHTTHTEGKHTQKRHADCPIWQRAVLLNDECMICIYIVLRKCFREWEFQCYSLGREGGNAELEAGVSSFRKVNPGEMFPALEQSVNLRQDQEQCYLRYLAAKASFPFLLNEVSPYLLRWVLWVLTYYKQWVSSELTEALPNWVLFPFG